MLHPTNTGSASEAGIRAEERQATEAYVCERLSDWLDETPRRPAVTAFTAGPMRDLARKIEERLAG